MAASSGDLTLTRSVSPWKKSCCPTSPANLAKKGWHSGGRKTNEDEMEKEGINAEVNVDESSGEVNIELKAN